MKKIPTMFIRDETKPGRPVADQIKPECEWVLRGEGLATIKMDGTNVKIENGILYKRQKPKEGEYDEASYVQVEPSDLSNKYILEAFDDLIAKKDGIYEAVGPKIQGNPQNLPTHELYRVVPVEQELELKLFKPTSFSDIKQFLEDSRIEGVVFHHPDGRMAKIKRRDFGLPWPVKAKEQP